MSTADANIYQKLSILHGLLHRQQAMRIMKSGPFSDTSRGQGRVLALLKIQPEISTKDMTYLLGIRQQSLNELLNRLERGGYVERKPSKADRRVMMVCLTEKGKSVQQPPEDDENVFGCLSEDELALFGQLLDRIIEDLDRRVGLSPEERQAWETRARAVMGDDRFERMMQAHGARRPRSPFGRR